MPITNLNHPVFSECLSGLRDKNTPSFAFRELAERAGFILAVEATRLIETVKIQIETPLTSCVGAKIKNKIVLVPILRAGLSLVPSFHKLLPEALVGHLGLRRDEQTAEASCYSNSLPDLTACDVIVLDPMLATGGSALIALELISQQKVNSLHCVSVIAAPEGIQKLERKLPTVNFTIGVVDECLNERSFIVPGLGDFGDRLFGT